MNENEVDGIMIEDTNIVDNHPLMMATHSDLILMKHDEVTIILDKERHNPL